MNNIQEQAPVEHMPTQAEVGEQCAELIRRRPAVYESAAEWVNSIEPLPVEGPRDELGRFLPIIGELPEHPICRRLLAARAYYEVRQNEADLAGHGQSLPRDEATRIVLVSALTFDRSFDGAEVGLNWPWRVDDGSKLPDGRQAAWSYADINWELWGMLVQKALQVLGADDTDRQCQGTQSDGARDGIRGLAEPVKLRAAAGIIGQRSDVIAGKLERAGCKVVKSGRCNWAEDDDVKKLYSKYREYRENKVIP
jgi:hypothetical protein